MSNQVERKKGIQIHRSIVYGSCARLLTPSEAALAPPGHSHRWFVFLASAATPPPRFKPGRPAKGTVPTPDDVLDEDIDWMTGGADDLSWLIKRVVFKLHDTYPSPTRAIDKPPFAVSETGWGEFPLAIRINFAAETTEKSINLSHNLKLHHWGPAVQGPVASAGDEGVGGRGVGAGGGDVEMEVDGEGAGEGAADAEGELDTAVAISLTGDGTGDDTNPHNNASAKPINSTNTPNAAEADADGEGEVDLDGEGDADAEGEGDADGEADGEGEDDIEVEAEGSGSGTGTRATSVAAGGGVKGEDGDMNANANANTTGVREGGDAMDIDAPPTGPTQPDAALSGQPSTSALTEEPPSTPSPLNPLPVHSWQFDQLIFSDPTQTFYDLLLAHPETPLPSKSLRRGAAEGDGAVLGGGDRGSAGVPMEFTRGLERGEEGRLEEARRGLVLETDKWRQRLIELEREAQQLKDEIAAGIV